MKESTDPHHDCSRAAARYLRHAPWPAAIVAATLFAGSIWPETLRIAPLPFLAACLVGALSTLLAFDALLFRLMATYPDDAAGGAAVDDLLARMRLKPRPPATRPLADRLRGTDRILLFQRLAFAVFVLGSLVASSQIG